MRRRGSITSTDAAAQIESVVSGTNGMAPRIVHLQTFIWRISHINTVERTFSCRFNLKASYLLEPDLIAKYMDRSDSKQWTSEHFDLTPNLRFMNLLTETAEREEWWGVSKEQANGILPPTSDLSQFGAGSSGQQLCGFIKT